MDLNGIFALVSVLLFLVLGRVAPQSEEIFALLEFAKGIRSDPLGLVSGTWNKSNIQSDGCPATSWRGVTCTGGHVTALVLDNFHLAGEVSLKTLSNLRMVGNLSLAGNLLSGGLEPEITNMSSLQHLDLSHNRFRGRIPKGFQNLYQLRHLDLHSNQLNGHIDMGLVNLQSAVFVDLSSNMLSGPLPPLETIGSNIRNTLQYLNVSNNRLTGALVYNVEVPFQNLKVLDMSNNQFSGKLPSFEYVYALETLRLGSNSFSGQLPSALFGGSSLNLQELDLSNNNLSEQSNIKSSLLDWHQRLKIAVDVGRGLVYLHCDVSLPHGNLKAANILLDGPELNGKLSDYCLHLLTTSAGTAEQIFNAGALGYRAPELAPAKKPKPSFKADVYAFGVILVEIITGNSAGDIVCESSGVVDLTDWVKQLATQGRGMDCFDSSLRYADTQEFPKGIDDVLAIALQCMQPVSERPSIRKVFEDLTTIEN